MSDRNQNDRANSEGDNKPTHVLKKRIGQGQKASYERLGVAWLNADDNSVYIRFYGTQIIDGGMTAYEIEER